MNRFDIKKKIISAIIITALALTGLAPSFAVCDSVMAADKPKAPKVHGESVVLMDMGSGKVLFKKGEKIVRQPASVTKILNLMVVLDKLEMDQQVTISDNVETRGSVVGFRPGEVVTVKDMIYGMMLWSGNDAAEELAKAAAGDVESFCKLMNEKAKECGATKTDYKNPNGLNENQDALNYTTAMDLAKISREAMKNPQFREIVSTVYYTIPPTNMCEEPRKMRNSNHCLWDEELKIMLNGDYAPLKYDGCNGIKTGYTSTAGNCYVGSATRGKTSLVVVVMGAQGDPERFEDAVDLWEYGFNNFKTITVEKKKKPVYEQKVKRGALRKVELGTKEDFMVTVAKNFKQEGNVITEVTTDEKKAQAPIEKGDKLGIITAYDSDGNKLGSTEVYALFAVDEGGILSHIGIADEDVPLFIFIVLGILILLVLFIRLRSRLLKNRKPRAKKSSKKSGARRSSKKSGKKSAGSAKAKAAPQRTAEPQFPGEPQYSQYPQYPQDPGMQVPPAGYQGFSEYAEQEFAAAEETAVRSRRSASKKSKAKKSGKMTRSQKAEASHKRSKSRMKRHREKSKRD